MTVDDGFKALRATFVTHPELYPIKAEVHGTNASRVYVYYDNDGNAIGCLAAKGDDTTIGLISLINQPEKEAIGVCTVAMYNNDAKVSVEV